MEEDRPIRNLSQKTAEDSRLRFRVPDSEQRSTPIAGITRRRENLERAYCRTYEGGSFVHESADDTPRWIRGNRGASSGGNFPSVPGSSNNH
jgi:hypothetical protein